MKLNEKIARAMCEADGHDWDAQTSPMTSSDGSDDGREYYFGHADAALSAIEPTDAMVEAGQDRIPYATDVKAMADAAYVFNAMIQAAIKEAAE